MTIIEQWAGNVAGTHFEKLDRGIVERAKQRIIDIVGCMIGGANAPGNRELADLVKDWGGKGEATIVAHGGKIPAQDAAMVNSIMARSFDYGVMGPLVNDRPVVAHLSETSVPTAVAAAEREHAGGKKLITALILGDDLAARMMAASPWQLTKTASKQTPVMRWGGIGTVTRFGATAIAGKLQGLDEHQLLNAFGIISNQLSGAVADWYGTHCFKLQQGISARDGIIAAELAKRGWTGNKEPLFSRSGYFNVCCQGCDDQETLTRNLGKEFHADSVFKPYPACRATHSAIDCALELVRKYDINADDIDELTISGTSRPGPAFELGELPQCSVNFTREYHVASVLVRKDVRLEYYTEEYIRDPKVLALAQKARMTGEIPFGDLTAAEVKVRMKDGREFSAAVEKAKGDPIEDPLTSEEIDEKFRGNVAFSKTVTEKNAEAALGMLKKLEEVGDVSQITKLLVA